MELKSVEEFNRFVNGLDEKEVQGWKSADWVKMYKALDNALFQDDGIKLQVIERFDKLLKEGKISPERYNDLCYPETDVDKEKFLTHARSIFMTDDKNRVSMEKMYKNYRFEERDLQVMAECGKEVGKKLADMRVDMATVNVTNIHREEAQQDMGEMADAAVYETTNYSKMKYNPYTGEERAGYDKVKSNVKLTEQEKLGGAYGETSHEDPYAANIQLTDSLSYDGALTTAVHESVHAHTQVDGRYQRYEKMVGLLPRSDMSDGFYDMMEYNNKYYFLASGRRAETKEEFVGAYKAYDKQPVEKMADFVATTAERTFRREANQNSERTARDISMLIDDTPLRVAYMQNVGQVALLYDCKTLGEGGKSIEAMRETYLKDVDDETFSKMRLFMSEGMMIVVTPKGYDARMGIKKALDMKYDREKTAENKVVKKINPAVQAAVRAQKQGR